LEFFISCVADNFRSTNLFEPGSRHLKLSFWKEVSAGAAVIAAALAWTVSPSANAAVAKTPSAPSAKVSNTAVHETSVLPGRVYRLRMHELHTGESIDIVYRIGSDYIPGAVAELNYFLRDHRTNQVSHYDVREFDLLNSVMAKLGRPGGLIDVVCGYRTPWSNNYLRARAAVSGVALHSQHMLAKAIDIRVPGVSTSRLRDVALSLHEGGVGYYPVSQFVHVDVGPVRRWTFAGAGD
jgi:uncharacterized protein YcbK (DUF882 family)